MGFFDWLQDKAKDAASTGLDVAQAIIPDSPAEIASSIGPMGMISAAGRAAQAMPGMRGTAFPTVQRFPGQVNNAIVQAAVPPAVNQAIEQGSLRPLTQVPGGYLDMARGVGGYLQDRPSVIADYWQNTYQPNLLNTLNNADVTNPRDWLMSALAVADPYVRIANDPIEQVHESQGQGAYEIAQSGGQMRDRDAAQMFNFAAQWAMEHPEEWPNIIDAYENGYNGYTGDRAVWEYYIGKQDQATRVAAEIVNDPWNALAFGSGALGKGLMRGGAAIGARGAPNLGAALTATGRGVRAADAVVQGVLDAPFRGAGWLGRQAAQTGPGRAVVSRLFAETAESTGRRLSDKAVTHLNNLADRPLTDQALPDWAVPVTGTGEYTGVAAADPVLHRNTGAAYVVDPQGRPIPGFAFQWKGAIKDANTAAKRINDQDAWRPEGVEGEYTGMVPQGDISGTALTRRGEGPSTQRPLMGGTTLDALDAGATVPGAPEGGFTPYWFMQTPEQRREWIRNGMSVAAPNIGDDRLTTKIEQMRATRPEVAAAFEADIGLNRTNGAAIDGSPLARLDADLDAIRNGPWIEDTPELGGLDAKAVDEKLRATDFVINQLADIYQRHVGVQERPGLTRRVANSSVANDISTLYSAAPGSEERRAAIINLFERAILGPDDAIRRDALDALMDMAIDFPWLRTRIDYARNLMADMDRRTWVVTPDVTAPTATPEAPKTRYQSLIDALALETDPARQQAILDELRELHRTATYRIVTPPPATLPPAPPVPRESPYPPGHPLYMSPAEFDTVNNVGRPGAPADPRDLVGRPTMATRLRGAGPGEPPPDIPPTQPPPTTPPDVPPSPATPPENPPTGTGGAAAQAAPASDIRQDPVGNYITQLDDGRTVIAFRQPDGTYDVAVSDPNAPDGFVDVSQAVRSGNVENVVRRVRERPPRPQAAPPPPPEARNYRTTDEVLREDFGEEAWDDEITAMAERISEMERTGVDPWESNLTTIDTPAGPRTVTSVRGRPTTVDTSPNGVMHVTSQEAGREYIAPNGTAYRVEPANYRTNNDLLTTSQGDSFSLPRGKTAKILDAAYKPINDPATVSEFGQTVKTLADGWTVVANKTRKGASQRAADPVWWVVDPEGNVVADHLPQDTAIQRARRGTIERGRPRLATPVDREAYAARFGDDPPELLAAFEDFDEDFAEPPQVRTPEGDDAPEGYTRLYRAETRPENRKPKPDWIKLNQDESGMTESVGRWFAPDRKEVQWYVDTEYPDGRVVAIDVRNDLVERYRVSNITDEDAGGRANPRRFGTRPDKEFFLPRDMAGMAQEVKALESLAEPPQVPRITTPEPERIPYGTRVVVADLDGTMRDGIVRSRLNDGSYQVEFPGERGPNKFRPYSATRIQPIAERPVPTRAEPDAGRTADGDIYEPPTPVDRFPYGGRVQVNEPGGPREGILRDRVAPNEYRVEFPGQQGAYRYGRFRDHQIQLLDEARPPLERVPTRVEQAAPAVGDPSSPTVIAPQPRANVASAQIDSLTGDTGVILVRTDSLSTDPARFQPRQGLDEAKVQNSADMWARGEKPPPLEVWADPSDGKVYILAGHHRLEGARRAGIEEIAVMPFRGTEDQARIRAATSNTQAPQTDLENAGVARMLRDQGTSWKDIRTRLNLRSEAHGQKLVAASYAPNTVKEYAKIPADQGGASLNLLASMGRPIMEGEATVDEMARLFDFLRDRDGALPSPDKIDSFMAVAQIRREAIARGDVDPTAAGTAQTLFDLTGLTGNGVVSDAIRFIEEMGDAKRALEIQRGALINARNKQARTGIDVRGADDAIADAEKQLEVLEARMREFSVRDAFGVTEPPPQTPAPLGESGGVVRTQAGLQNVMAGMPQEELTLRVQEVDEAAPELTPEQRRAQELAAGQQDMFGIRLKASRPEVQAWADRMIRNGGPLEPIPEPVGNAMVDEWVRRGDLGVDEGEVLREVFPGLNKPLVDEYYDRLRIGMSPYEARSEIRNTIYKTLAPTKALPEGKIAKRLVQGWRAIGKFTQMVRQNMMYNLANLLSGGIADMLGNDMHLWQTGRLKEMAANKNTLHIAFAGGEPAIADAFNKQVDEVYAGQNRNIPEYIIPQSGQVYETKLGMKDDSLVIWDWALAASRKLGKDDIPRGFKAMLSVAASPRARAFRQGIDANSKSVLHKGVVDSQLDDEVARFRESLIEAGLPADATIAAIRKHATDQRATPGFREWHDGNGTLRHFDASDVLAVTRRQDLARQWRSAQNRMFKNADAAVRETFFANRARYKIDDAFANVMFFHYWQSRALALQVRSMIRNPRVLGGYYRMIQGAMNEADKNGYPATFRGMVHYWGDTTAGWFGMFNPLGVLVPAMMFSDLAQTQGEEGAWAKIQSILPLTPMVSGAVAALGVSDFVPNMTGTTRVQNIVADVVNWGNAHGFDFTGGLSGGGYVHDPVQAITRWVLQSLNDIAQKVGAPAYNPYDQVDGKIDTTNSVVIHLAQQRYGEDMSQWTPQQWADVQDALLAVETGGRGNPLADEAFRQATDAYLKNRLASVIAPQGSVIRYGPREESRKAAREGDMDAQFERNLATGTQDNRALLIAQAQLNDVGTETQRSLWEAWNTIAYSTDLKDGPGGFVTILGQQIPMREIQQLSQEDRFLIADAVIAEAGGTEELKAYRDARDAFIAQNPTLASYDQYNDTARNFPGGMAAFRKWAAEVSPEFAREMERERERLRERGYRGRMIDASLDAWARGRAGYLAFRGANQRIYDEPALPGAANVNDPDSILAMVAALRGGNASGAGFGQGQGSEVPYWSTMYRQGYLGRVQSQYPMEIRPQGYNNGYIGRVGF